MAAIATILPPYFQEPYYGEPAEPTISAYQSMSAHPAFQRFSFEELRLAHYNVHRKEARTYLSDTSKLMTTQQRSALKMTHPSRTIRAAVDNTDKYVLSEDSCEFCS